MAPEAEQAPEREVIIRNEAGDVLGQDMTRPTRDPGQRTEFQVDMNDGSTLILQFPRRERRAGEARRGRPWWARGPGGLLWILGIVALAVAIGSYPIIRRLTLRLDHLRMGVERWGEGDLSCASRNPAPTSSPSWPSGLTMRPSGSKRCSSRTSHCWRMRRTSCARRWHASAWGSS